MQTYVWGILISTFILDVIKNNLGVGSENKIENDYTQNSHQTYSREPHDYQNSKKFENSEPKLEGMKIKLEGQDEIPIEYDSSPSVISNKKHKPLNYDKVVLRFQYCTS